MKPLETACARSSRAPGDELRKTAFDLDWAPTSFIMSKYLRSKHGARTRTPLSEPHTRNDLANGRDERGGGWGRWGRPSLGDDHPVEVTVRVRMGAALTG
jgi:hypothetical protein